MAPACPDDGESDLAAARRALDRSALPPDFTLPADPAQQKAVAFALAQVGKPYVFGAKGPDAFDCSGLMQAAWAAAGVGISAGTLTQIHDGVAVAASPTSPRATCCSPRARWAPPTHPRHVGMYVGHGLVVDAFSTQGGVIMERLAAGGTRLSPSAGSAARARRRPAARLPRPRRGGA